MNPYGRAIEIIKERGWHQGGLSGPNGEVCMGQALFEAGIEMERWADRCLEEAIQRVAPFPANGWSLVPIWQDDPSRTIEDVFLALKHAAADWDAEHLESETA